jgi:phytoene desaturase
MAVIPEILSRLPGARALGDDAPWREALRASLQQVFTPTDRLRTGGDPIPVTEDSPHAVVIGAGFGGLAAAIRLGARGYRVTVVDRLDRPGGRARVWRDDGFVFDAGPTVITAPFLLEELWQLAGKEMKDDVELVEVAPFYRIRFDDGDVFDYNGDPEWMRSEILRLAPEDYPGYERFLAHSERIFRIGYEKLAHVPFDTAWDMARIVPSMMKLENYRSVYSLVSKYIKNDKLRQVLSFHPLLVGGNPYSCSSIYALICFLERKWGVWFAKGGTGELIRGMVGLVEHLGGTVRAAHRRRGDHGEGREGHRGPPEGRRAPRGGRRGQQRRRRLDLPAPRGVRAPPLLAQLAHRALEDVDEPLRLVLRHPDASTRTSTTTRSCSGPATRSLLNDIFKRKVLADDFSLYLHRPTATDPSMAPEGTTPSTC